MTKRQKSLTSITDPLDSMFQPACDTPELMRDMGFLSVKDLCAKLGVQRLAVYRLIKRLEVQTTQIGNKQFVNMDDLQKKIVSAPPRKKPRPRKGKATTSTDTSTAGKTGKGID